jgi:hypothetical protein
MFFDHQVVKMTYMVFFSKSKWNFNIIFEAKANIIEGMFFFLLILQMLRKNYNGDPQEDQRCEICAQNMIKSKKVI